MAVLALAAIPDTAAEPPSTVTIYRDSYGVPHVYGDSGGAAAFGIGYAQAEDRLDALLLNYLKAEGHAARALGAKGFDRDVEARMYRYAEVAQRRFPDLGPEVRADLTHFVAGVRRYMKEHPAEVPAWAPDPQPWHPVALSRLIAMPWPLGQAREDLWKAEPEEGRGSNAWAVSRGRSAEGRPILLIDPHLPWNDETLFYEVHLHGGDLHAFGHTFAGLPYPIVGHNDRIAWAFTTGGPDCADIYEEETDPSDPLRYRYDGVWRDMAVESVEAEVRTDRGAEVRRKEIHRTHHGPVVDRRGGDRAYVVKTAYDGEAGLLDGLRRVLLAKGLADFRAALGTLFMVPQNVLYADCEDNLYYVHVGRVPVRPDGFAWDRPVPGHTSATEWKGVHPLPDLASCLNPSVGFIQNCNVSPGTMFPDSPMTPDRYLPYIYNDRGDRTNGRGSRVVDILLADAQVELETAQQLATDTYVRDAEPWQQALAEAYYDQSEAYRRLSQAVGILREWDRQADADSPGMTLYRSWRRALRPVNLPEDQLRAIQRGKSVRAPTQVALLAALDQAVQQMQRTYGKVEVPWGDAFRLRRGDRTWPLSGAWGEGFGVLRSVGGGDPDRAGITYASRGQSCTTLVLLGDPAQSFSVAPWGQSNRPDSPHYADQADRLFSREQFKPTWYTKEALLQNLESKKTLTVEISDER